MAAVKSNDCIIGGISWATQVYIIGYLGNPVMPQISRNVVCWWPQTPTAVWAGFTQHWDPPPVIGGGAESLEVNEQRMMEERGWRDEIVA